MKSLLYWWCAILFLLILLGDFGNTRENDENVKNVLSTNFHHSSFHSAGNYHDQLKELQSFIHHVKPFQLRNHFNQNHHQQTSIQAQFEQFNQHSTTQKDIEQQDSKRKLVKEKIDYFQHAHEPKLNETLWKDVVEATFTLPFNWTKLSETLDAMMIQDNFLLSRDLSSHIRSLSSHLYEEKEKSKIDNVQHESSSHAHSSKVNFTYHRVFALLPIISKNSSSSSSSIENDGYEEPKRRLFPIVAMSLLPSSSSKYNLSIGEENKTSSTIRKHNGKEENIKVTEKEPSPYHVSNIQIKNSHLGNRKSKSEERRRRDYHQGETWEKNTSSQEHLKWIQYISSSSEKAYFSHSSKKSNVGNFFSSSSSNNNILNKKQSNTFQNHLHPKRHDPMN